MKKTKKGIALLTMSAVLAGIVPAGTIGLQDVHAADIPKALVDFDFEELEANQEIKTDTAKATGTYELKDSHAGGGKALSLNGTDQWLNITDEKGQSILTGKKELTFSYDAKMPKNHVNWGVFAARDASATEYQKEHYVGTVHNPGADKDYLVAERFNGGERPSSARANINAYDNKWVHVDVVHTENDVTLYLDGKEVGKEKSKFALTDILKDKSVLQLGKANWGAGEYGKGLIDNFRIYGEALNQDQITKQYAEYILPFDIEALDLPSETDRSLTLPSQGASGETEITWSSSNQDVMANDGTITRGDEDQTVTMTATLKMGEVTDAKEFQVVVKKKDPDADVETYTKELTLNAGFVSEDMELPEKIGDAAVTWKVTGGTAIKIEGNTAVVTRGEKNEVATLTATINVSGATKNGTKEFPLTVIAKGTDVATYVSSKAPTDIESEGYGLQGGMKLAAEGEEGYEALHKDQPVLYSSIGAKKYTAPSIFRKEDGASFGVIASDGGSGTVLLYDSKDLITYENQRSVALPDVKKIEEMTCVYDSTDKVYKIFVQAGDAVTLLTTKDFKAFENKGASSYKLAQIENAPADAVWAEGEALTKDEYDKVSEKFKNPYNTEINISKKDVTLKKGDKISSEIISEKSEAKATATYSNGTEMEYGITWDANDIAKIDTNRPGTYTVGGTVGTKYTDAEDPLIPERADPHIIYNEDDKYYYFTSSYPMVGADDNDGYDRLILRRAKTIAGLADAEEVTIWDEKDDPKRGRFIWAPELHKIGDTWYFLSTAAVNDGKENKFDIRPFMVKCTNSKDMMNPKSWEMAGDVKAKAGDGKNCLNAMSLDMTYFEAGGNHYLCWADKTQGNESRLYIATINPDNPTQLTSNCAVITKPEFFWEQVRFWVNEGPAAIKKDGKVHLAFSASGTGSEYCIGVLTADENADLTKPENWTKNPYPIMTSTDFNDEVSGPGHNSFTIDENGNQIIVYHARPTEAHKGHTGDPLFDPCRHAYIKPVFYGKDGMPILNMSDEEFAKEAKTSIKITIEGDAADTTPSLEYKFDEKYSADKGVENTGKDKDKNAVLSEGASYEWDEEYGQVLYLDGDKSVKGHNAFLTFPKGVFDNKNRMTISMDVKEVTRSGNYFTFGVGQDSNKYLMLKVAPNKIKAAISKESWQNEKSAVKQGVYPNNRGVWQNIKIVVTEKSLDVYRDGKKIASNNKTGISMKDLGEDLQAYLGKSFYDGDKYFRAYYDNVKVYDWAMTAEEVKSLTKQDETAREEEMGSVAVVAGSVTIPNADNIKGNITLPAKKDGVTIKWTSSNEDVISTKKVKNEGYDDTPAGVVTRQKKDTKVTLKAVFSKEGSKSITKEYKVTVKAAVEKVKAEDYVGYLFVRFNGTEENVDQEQTYFSISEDGLNWKNLNGNKPVLPSNIGESGLRDHFIARSAEGDKFYLIATDLSIATNKPGDNANEGAVDWWGAGGSGSHGIVVWESDDLVNWSEPWLSEIAPEGAGCTWAPEFIYDEKTGEYVVYWSATKLEVDENENVTQEFENHAIYYSKTRDFRTFTEPKLYHEGGKDANGKVVKVIDSTMIQDGDTYYRFTKNESDEGERSKTIVLDKSKSILGEFTEIPSESLSVDLKAQEGAVEGPIIFKMNEKTKDGEDQWCLMVDRYGTGKGYYPLITTNLNSGEFRLLKDNEYSFPKGSKFRHGYVMPVTASEYDALQRKWGEADYMSTYLLEQTIAKAEAVDEKLYTEASYQALQDAIAKAKEALNTVKTTEEADQAAAELQKALDALELKDDTDSGEDPDGEKPDEEKPDGDKPSGGNGSSGDNDGNSGSSGNSGNGGTGDSHTGSVKTGDVAPIGTAVVLLVAAGAVIVVVMRRKRS